tara:strand:- start:240 stop:380 length:141 start_codon:yes stop_codon:yes gene_type:complete
MVLIFLQAKIGQNFENAGQIWGKDRAKDRIALFGEWQKWGVRFGGI